MSIRPASSLELSRTCHLLRGLIAPLPPFFRSRRDPSLVPQDRPALFRQLSQEFQNRIYGIIYRLAGSPQNVEFNWGEVHVFDSFPRLQSAIHELACGIFDGLNAMQRDFVAGWVYHHAGRLSTTDLNWGQTHAKEDADRLLLSLFDYFEIEPEIHETQEAFVPWLTDESRQPDEQRETAAERVLSFIADPRRSLPFSSSPSVGVDHILDLSGLNLSDVSFLSMPQIGLRVEVLKLYHNRLRAVPLILPTSFPNLRQVYIDPDVEFRLMEMLMSPLPRTSLIDPAPAARAPQPSGPIRTDYSSRSRPSEERTSRAPQPSGVSRFAFSRGSASPAPQPSGVSRFAFSRGPEGRPLPAPQQNGVAYIETAIISHLHSLPEEEAKEFKKLMTEYDEEIFSSIPRFVIDQAITSSVPLTRDNVPVFLHGDVKALEELRKKREKFDKEMARMNPAERDAKVKEIFNEVGRYVIPLTQNREFRADMQKALEKFS